MEKQVSATCTKLNWDPAWLSGNLETPGPSRNGPSGLVHGTVFR